LQCDMI